jgi:serine protease Do
LRLFLVAIAFMPCLSPTRASAQAEIESNPLAKLSGSIRELTRRISPSVVEIIVTGYESADDQQGRVSNQISMQKRSASGVIVDPAGYIMTNAHVVLGAIKVEVLIVDNPRAEVEARIVGIDAESDLALLRVTREGLPSLDFGNSDQVGQGDLVFAIGSPVGLRNSLSMGVVSAAERSVNDENPIQYIQTDAPINPGNSGGALVNSQGALIGLNTYIVSQSGGSEGIGFAIPSNLVCNIYHQLREKGRVSRGAAGLFVQNITDPLAIGLGLPLHDGVVIADIDPDGPADRAGLKRGDVVLSIDGRQIQQSRQLDSAVYEGRPGEKLHLVIQRSRSRLDVTLTVAELQDPVDPLASLISPQNNLIARLGILCVEIDRNVADALPDLRRRYGLIVAAKAPSGPAQLVDLQSNDVIQAINNQTVTDLAIFRKTIDALKPGTAVVLQIERNQRLQYVAFNIQ